MAERSRNWCATLNNPLAKHEVQLEVLDCKYVIFGREVGASGTPHLQITVIFTAAKTMAQVLKVLPGSPHVEPCVDVFASIEYCKKDGDYVERGVPPMSRKTKGDGEKERWREILHHAKNNQIDEIEPKVQVVHFRNLTLVRDRALLERQLPDTLCKMEWIWGDTGTGKSRCVREWFPPSQIYLKKCNKWWDGYDGEPVVLIEDVDTSHGYMCHDLKIWGDRYAFPMEVKGGGRKIRPALIIVTSNHHPNMMGWPIVDLDAIERRYNIRHFTRTAGGMTYVDFMALVGPAPFTFAEKLPVIPMEASTTRALTPMRKVIDLIEEDELPRSKTLGAPRKAPRHGDVGKDAPAAKRSNLLTKREYTRLQGNPLADRELSDPGYVSHIDPRHTRKAKQVARTSLAASHGVRKTVFATESSASSDSEDSEEDGDEEPSDGVSLGSEDTLDLGDGEANCSQEE